MGWSVVHFTNENTVEAVPSSWYVTRSKECFWPPKGIRRDKIFKIIEQSLEPLSDWEIHPAALLGTYEDLTTAKRKSKKATETSELSSNAENVLCSIRKRKRNPKYNYDSSDSEMKDSSDENLYPDLAKNLKSLAIPNTERKRRSNSTPPKNSVRRETTPKRSRSAELRISTSNQYMGVSSVPSIDVTASDIPHQVFSPRATSATTNIRQSGGHTFLDNKEFQKAVLNELANLNLKVNSLIDNVNTLIRLNHAERDLNLASCMTNLRELYEKIPIKDEDGLRDLESWLDNEENYKIMANEIICVV